MSFLNAAFKDTGKPLIASVEILNPFMGKEDAKPPHRVKHAGKCVAG